MDIFNKLASKVKLNIKGKNIQRFIKRLISHKIEMLKISYPSWNEVNIIVYKKDYDKIMELKSIYEVSELNTYGLIKIKKTLSLYKYLIMAITLSLIIMVFLSNVIFDINVIHTDSDVRKFLLNELEDYGISKYKFKKSFNEIQNIKKQILEKYKDKIEWLEIEESGTTYIVRIEERIIIDNKTDNTSRNIVAKKSGILKKIIAEDGQVMKELNTFVNQGEVVISGNIYLNEEIKNTIKANGSIYAEVWYNVSVEYPYIYSEIKYTGNSKKVYALKLFDKTFELTFNKFKEKNSNEKVLIGHNLLPISLVLQEQKEIVTISSVLTEEQAIEEAIKEAKTKMDDKLNDDESIIDYQILKTTVKEDKIVLDVFFSVLENITEYQVIEESDSNVP